MSICMDEFKDAMGLCVEAHANYSKKESNKTRIWDGKTPYAVHPIWCATAFLQETNLEMGEETRKDCFFALLFHDLLEDTTMALPQWLSCGSVSLIKEMTVESTEIEIREIWSKPSVIRLLKLYDKVSNLLDGLWMSDKKWNEQYVPYVLCLADDVESVYGNLNIVRVSRAIAIRRLVSNNPGFLPHEERK